MEKGWTVAGTCRDAASLSQLEGSAIEAFLFDGAHPLADAGKALEGASHVLCSIPPGPGGDPALRHHQRDIQRIEGLEWTGYLSTTGVYGDTAGRVVDETAPLNPTSERGRQRVAAEKQWLALAKEGLAAPGAAAHIFRLSGIYGPGSSMLDRVRDGTAKRIDKPDCLFSRIHVADIANVVMASMARPNPGAVYNLADDAPATASEVTALACELLGAAPPPLVPFDEAAKEMSPMALSFWKDNRRVDNARIKKELGVKLKYPDYRSGLKAILAS